MQRETTDFVTKSGTKVKLYTYLTAREANSIKEDIYKTMKIDTTSGASVKPLSDTNGTIVLEQEKKLLSLIVVSLNGAEINSNIESLLDLRNDDYQEIVTEVNRIYSTNFTPAK